MRIPATGGTRAGGNGTRRVASLHGEIMTARSDSARELLTRTWADLGGEPEATLAVSPPRHRVPLPARTDVAGLAWASAAAASLAAGALAPGARVSLDPDRIAVAYASERYFRIGGDQPAAWAPLSGFFRTSDGWVRTHGNYPHHAAALRRALGLAADAGAEDAASALLDRPAAVSAREITAAGGLCVVVASEDPLVDARLRESPLVGVTRVDASARRRSTSGSAAAPLRGIRILDLTRVIAGPVSTRTLALLGADVLRIDPRRLPEPEWQHFDTGHGKRSAVLDLRVDADRTAFDELARTADVIVTGYRARALERLGLGPEALIARNPGLIVARLTAWGTDGDDADRRGFDSLVQAASGIAWIESADGDRPGALPAQALDHSAGYLLAAGVLSALARRSGGGSWIVDVSLRRIAAELLGMPRTDSPEPAWLAGDPSPHLQEFDVDGIRVTTTAPALAYDGGPTAFAPPRRWGRDDAVWA